MSDQEDGKPTFEVVLAKTKEELLRHREVTGPLRSVDPHVSSAFNNLYDIIVSLCDYLGQANDQILLLKNQKARKDEQGVSIPTQPQVLRSYSTDEEDTQRETDWILKRASKKRKARSSPEVAGPSNKSSVGSSKVATKLVETRQNKKKDPPPPPINIVGLRSFSALKEIISNIPKEQYKVTALNNNVWKINVESRDNWKIITDTLRTDKKQWYTYQDKTDRPIKVMARGLHPTCEKNEIIDDLKNQGLKILDVTNILKKERKRNERGEIEINQKPLPLYMLTFDRTEDINKIHEIKAILNIIVKIEPVKKTTKLIPQCKKCQSYLHTQSYCGKEPACVKCAGPHITSECKMNKTDAPRCVNCKGNHPANYRGCEVAKELQRLRNNATKSHVVNPNRSQQTKRDVSADRSVTRRKPLTATITGATPKVSYSSVVSKKEANEEKPSVEQMLAQILEKINEQNHTNKVLFERITKLEKGLSNYGLI